MKLDKAIEIGRAKAIRYTQAEDFEVGEALELLVEAGKRIQKGRTTGALGVSRLLPGETED